MTYVTTSSMMFDVSNNLFLQFPSRLCQLVLGTGLLIFRAVADPRNSGISAKSREISKKTAKYREIRQKYFQIYMSAKHI